MKFDAEVKREIYKIAVGCGICTAITMVVFLAIRRFDYTVAIGGAIGFASAFGNFFFMCVGVIRALETGDEASAKLKLRSSYIMRTVVQIGLIALALALDFINWIPVALAVFYPRITITVCDLWKTFVKKDVPAADAVAEAESDAETDGAVREAAEVTPSDEDEEEQTDEFEKFVSGFYKGDKTK